MQDSRANSCFLQTQVSSTVPPHHSATLKLHYHNTSCSYLLNAGCAHYSSLNSYHLQPFYILFAVVPCNSCTSLAYYTTLFPEIQRQEGTYLDQLRSECTQFEHLSTQCSLFKSLLKSYSLHVFSMLNIKITCSKPSTILYKGNKNSLTNYISHDLIVRNLLVKIAYDLAINGCNLQIS